MSRFIPNEEKIIVSDNESTTKELLPDVQAYFDQKGKAEEVFRAGVAKINADPRFQVGVLEDRYAEGHQEKRRLARIERDALDTAYYEAPQRAWNDHLATSENPMVKWVADHARDYTCQADQILRLLPASREELDAYASRQDWCSEWHRLANAAEEAGVFPPDTNPPALRELRRHVRRNVRQDRQGGVLTRADAAITEAVEAAKLEWLASLPEAQASE